MCRWEVWQWFMWASRKLYKPSKILTQRERKPQKTTLCQTTQDWDVEKNLRYTRLMKVRKWEKLRWFDVSTWSCTSLMIVETEEERQKGFTENPYCLPLYVQAQQSSTLSYSTHTYISSNKKKSKEADYIFIHQHCYVSQPNNITNLFFSLYLISVFFFFFYIYLNLFKCKIWFG